MKRIIAYMLSVCIVAMTFGVIFPISVSAATPETFTENFNSGGISSANATKIVTPGIAAGYTNGKLEYNSPGETVAVFIDARDFQGATSRNGVLTYDFKFNASATIGSAQLGYGTSAMRGDYENLYFYLLSNGIMFNDKTLTGTKDANNMYHTTLEFDFVNQTITATLDGAEPVSRKMGSNENNERAFRFGFRAGGTVNWSLDDITVTYVGEGGTSEPEISDDTTGLVDFNNSVLPSYMTFNGGVTSFVDASDSLETGEVAGNASGKVLKLSHSSSGGVSLAIDLATAMPNASGTSGIMTYEFDYNQTGDGINPGVKINGNDYVIAQLYDDSISSLYDNTDETTLKTRQADYQDGWNRVKLTLDYETGKIYTQINGGTITEGNFTKTKSSLNLVMRAAVSTTNVWYLDNFKATFQADANAEPPVDTAAITAKLNEYKGSVAIPTAKLSTGMIALPGDADGDITITVESSSDTNVIANGAVAEIGVVSGKTCRSIVVNHPEKEKTVTFTIKLAVGDVSVTKECSVTVLPKRAVEIYNAKISDGVLTSVTMKKNTASSAKVFATVYKGNVLTKAATFDAATKTESLSLAIGSGETLKFFVWDSVSGLKPLQTVLPESEKPTLHILADSIYAEERVEDIEAEQAGIGLKLKDYFDTAKMPINNKAICGWTTYDFADHVSSGDYRMNGVLNSIKAGDYVLVSFNHNDQKVMDLGASDAPVYTKYITRFVNEIRSKGATPILVTAIPRLVFEGSFTGNNADHVRFIEAMDAVAKATACDIVDLNAWFTSEITNAGYNSAKAWFDTVNSDTTHLSHAGATKCANWLGAELVKLYPALSGFVAK